MKLSKKLKTKLKKNTTIALTSIALVTTTLAALKLADISMPVNTLSLLESDNKTSATTINRLPNTETVTYIYDASDLVAFRDAVNAGNNYSGKIVYLMDDIDLSTVCSSTLGSFMPIGATGTYFAGTFDGNYHTIKNLYMSYNTYLNLGFFAKTTETSVIKKLLLENVNIYNGYNSNADFCNITGGIVGTTQGKIINCGVNSGNIKGQKTTANSGSNWKCVCTGGIVGQLSAGEINQCYNRAYISCQNVTQNYNSAYVGGILGRATTGSKIINCYNTGTVYASAYFIALSGIVGDSLGSSTTETNCYNIGTTSLGSGSTKFHAGVLGRGSSHPSNCYSMTSNNAAYYYANSLGSYSYTGRVAKETILTYTTVLGNSYAYDVYGINNGYPVLAWQNETTVMSLNKNQAYIGVGESLSLNVIEKDEVTEIIGENYEATNFTWTSTNEDVATVNENGVVTGISAGYTTVYAHHETSGLYAMCVVNVAKGVANPQIETGNGFTAILKADGTVWTIGNNAKGTIGNGTTENVNVPTSVYIDEDTALNNIVKIAVGTDHVLALTKNGNVYAWGANSYGQLGQNDTNSLSYAKLVLGEDGSSYLSNIVDISAGAYGSSAIDKDGNVYVWGNGSYGEIGNKATDSKNLPTKTTIKNAIQVSMGQGQVAVLTSEGVVWSWGRNSNGQLGINCTNNTSYPMKTALNVTELSVGGYHTMVKKIDGTLYASRSIFLWKIRNRKHSRCKNLCKSKFTKYSNRRQ